MTPPLKPMDREAWEKRLKEIEVMAEAATPGPWVKDGNGTGGHIKSMPTPPRMDPKGFESTPTVCLYDIWTRMGIPMPDAKDREIQENKDGIFIAHARQDIPDLVAYARALQSSNEALTSEVCTLNNRIEEIDRTYNFQREEDAAKLAALQTQLTEAQAEVERLRGC